MAVAVAVAAAGLAPAAAMPAARAAGPGGTPLVLETFTGATAPAFTGYNGACLTGAAAEAAAPRRAATRSAAAGWPRRARCLPLTRHRTGT
jgi:hypothetical protein